MCEKMGVPIVAMKPFAAGNILKGNEDGRLKGLLSLTPVQCISYILSFTQIACPVPGVKNVEELKESLAYITATEAERDFSEINDSLVGKFQKQCMYCNHCQPCPKKIDIAEVTKLADMAETELTTELRDRYDALVVKGGDCIHCRSCSKRCPFGIDGSANMAMLCVGVGLLIMVFDFRRVKQKHEMLECIKSISDVVSNVLPKAESMEDVDYQKIIHLIGEEHNSYRINTSRQYADMVDYYTVWVHQIKTPIASMRLHLQNEDTAFARKLYADLHRIEQYVEMVLTFLRLNSDNTDYVFREYDLDKIIKQSVKKFSYDFIGRKLNLVYEPVNTIVLTDEKWLSFVIEQVLSNALKYTRSGSITISLDAAKKLSIRDTGIGIAPEDLPRIFQNGYTGYNGRSEKSSSGIDLYLCKRICTNLGHTISAASVINEGTVITIDLARTTLQVE